MAIMEILNFGTLPGSPGAAPVILSRSSGIDQVMADEIVRLCKGWGQPLVVDEERPAILSFPLKTGVKVSANGAFAVIKVQGASNFLFRVAVLSQSGYALFGYNPFAVVEAGAFPVWDPAAIPVQQPLKQLKGDLEISPLPSPEDVGMVDEALHQLLASHKLYLPIENSTRESDRCLALLIEVMPVALKKQLRFASFAPSPANGYHLAATATAECEFSGWQRLMMTLVGGALPDNQDRYVKSVRDCLAFGDLGVIREQSKLLPLNVENVEIKKKPAPQIQMPTVDPVVASVSPPRPFRSSGKNKKPISVRSGKKTTLAQQRGGQRQLPGFLVGLLVLVMTIGGGWTYLEFFHGGRGIQWNELVSWPGQGEKPRQNRVASLLEVPNVGDVYNRQIKKINRAAMIPGLNQETDQRRGLVNLKNDAAIPLLAQVDLFLDLASAGIRQGNRPDREGERLKALAHQGKVLEVEVARLELAWHSLSSCINWRDLTALSDDRVVARRDSLQNALPSALKAAAQDMNFGPRLKKLGFATGQTKGMSQLVALFQVPQWSPEWNTELYRAAELVSPSASKLTRAYRNSAFTLIRLKNAEHQDVFTSGAFVDNLVPGVWPGENVTDILPGLSREVGKFSKNETPPLLKGTLQLYQTLENPVLMVEGLIAGQTSLEILEDNPAVLFDSEVYTNYLERLRYEGALIRAELYPENEQSSLVAFEMVRQQPSLDKQWEKQISIQGRPFLKRWAAHEKNLVQQELLSDLSGFDEHWNEVQLQVEKLRARAQQGHDWTGVWVDLNSVLDRSLVAGEALSSKDPTVAAKVQEMHALKAMLAEPRNIELTMVTVRVEQNLLSGPERAVFEFQTLPDGKIHRSASFNIGPAAPAGSGWVGTVRLEEILALSPMQKFRGTVRSVHGDQLLVNVEYPSLSERVGPGALARPRSGSAGSLLIKIENQWWKSIRFPRPKEHSEAS